MDVDTSIRTRQVNYMNRPSYQQQAYKRPGSNRIHQPAKFQKINYVTPENEYDEMLQYQEQLESQEDSYGQTFVEYTNSQYDAEPEVYAEDHNNPCPEDHDEQIDEVHFLD